jgi:hypothetical protein
MSLSEISCYVNTNALNEIFGAFLAKLRKLGLDLDNIGAARHRLVYLHSGIPYLSACHVDWFEKQRVLRIKLYHDAFLGKGNDELVLIKKFCQFHLGHDFSIHFYYNETLPRIDIEARAKNKKTSDGFDMIVITYEFGNPLVIMKLKNKNIRRSYCANKYITLIYGHVLSRIKK